MNPAKSRLQVPVPDSTIFVIHHEQAVVRIQTPPSGFDWGDAAIGAAGGLALSLIAVGGALVVSQ